MNFFQARGYRVENGGSINPKDRLFQHGCRGRSKIFYPIYLLFFTSTIGKVDIGAYIENRGSYRHL